MMYHKYVNTYIYIYRYVYAYMQSCPLDKKSLEDGNNFCIKNSSNYREGRIMKVFFINISLWNLKIFFGLAKL